jgi:hypothetical protein
LPLPLNALREAAAKLDIAAKLEISGTFAHAYF